MKFRRVEIVEAEQFVVARKPWPKGVCTRCPGRLPHTHDPVCLLEDGDWIVTGVRGGHAVYSAKAFAAEFQPVDGADHVEDQRSAP